MRVTIIFQFFVSVLLSEQSDSAVQAAVEVELSSVFGTAVDTDADSDAVSVSDAALDVDVDGPVDGSKIFRCPETESPPLQVPSDTLIQIEKTELNLSTSSGSLCTLIRVTATADSKSFAPVARSYNGHDWENVAGPYASTSLKIDCQKPSLPSNVHVCEIQIPKAESKEQTFVLVQYERSLNAANEAARFFEQATFGTTRKDLNLVPRTNTNTDTNESQSSNDLQPFFTSWLHEQIYNVPPTLHRELWRSRAHSATRKDAIIEGAVSHPCRTGVRWRSEAFGKEDTGRRLTISIVNDRFALSIDGHIRTMTDKIRTDEGRNINDDRLPQEYKVCDVTPEDKRFKIMHKGRCKSLKTGRPIKRVIPLVDLDGADDAPTIFNIDEDLSNFMIRKKKDVIESMVMVESLDSMDESTCEKANSRTKPAFAKLKNGQFMMHEKGVVLRNNSQEEPLEDGGGTLVQSSSHEVFCSNAPRTFLNDDSCRMSTSENACSHIQRNAAAEIVLNKNQILNFHSTTDHEIHAVTGLGLNDPDLNYPCDKNTRTRWVPLPFEESSLCPNEIDESTETLFRNLIQTSTDRNPIMKDIFFTSDSSCHSNDSNRQKLYIIVDGTCWTNVHPDEYGVYDFRPWTSVHPGGRSAIAQFKNGESELFFFPKSHDVTRWRDNSATFLYLGRLGDSVKIEDLPEFIQDEVSVSSTLAGPGVVVCGSPGEVRNSGSSELPFEMTSIDKKTEESGMAQIRQSIWTTVVLSSDDQLRQRIAWALSQILAVSPDGFGTKSNEMFVSYYDIFVRNAFGNYRDILREVSYSPVMADMLTYHNSKSQEITWRTKRKIQVADENYAREVLQLFSIGLYRLNTDGTHKVDNDGMKILTYTNEDIEEYARTWTGFTRQQVRGNIEAQKIKRGVGRNSIDPMTANANWRDPYPKMGLDGSYVGDGYMLCEDIPAKSFLRQSATYRLLGKTKRSEVQHQFLKKTASDADIHVTVLGEDSSLRKTLCNSIDGRCLYAPTVRIDSTLNCFGSECDLDMVQVVKVAENVHYEYMKPPCVRDAIFGSGRIAVAENYSLCVDKHADIAAAACCPVGSTTAKNNSCKYSGEVMSYHNAKTRCTQSGMELCDFTSIDASSSGICRSYKGLFWYGANNSCKPVVIIDEDGNVALERQESPKQDYISLTFFRVHWKNEYPSAKNQCGNNICKSIKSYCRCRVENQKEAVYTTAPQRQKVLDELHIGGVPPTLRDYAASEDGDEIKIHFRKQLGVYDKDVVFEVTDDFGRVLYLRNIKATILFTLNGSTDTDFQFRSPPSFMNEVSPEVRDMQYETEAVLDHYFFHQNTAPFLAERFIQRFGHSNPSPRFVESVATAFKTGLFSTPAYSFGSSKYGDLSATIASILLDREFRHVVLDQDPSHGSLREPLLKVLALMRSMEYIHTNTRMNIGLQGTADSLGEMAHKIPSVFSFFLSDYASPGAVSNAFLQSPEGMLSHKTASMLNGLHSFIKFGLTGCKRGFGVKRICGMDEGTFDKSVGRLAYSPPSTTEVSVIDELTTLLTSGRLGGPNRDIIQNAYSSTYATGQDRPQALRVAQQLILSSAEFHTNGIPRNIKKNEELNESTTTKTCKDKYKAVVHLKLDGGIDSYNLLVPHSGCSGLASYKQYAKVRGGVSLPKDSLLQIDASTSSQPCKTFGIHPNMPFLKRLYDEKDASFVAGIGVLSAPVTRRNYKKKTKTTLYAHNAMLSEIDFLDPHKDIRGTGFLGRFADELVKKGYGVNSFSVDDGFQGLEGDSPTVKKVLGSIRGIERVGVKDDFIGQQAELLNSKVEGYNSVFSDAWSSALHNARNADEFYWAYENSHVTEDFPAKDFTNVQNERNTNQRLKAIARMIVSSECRGSDRDLFYMQYLDFDHHSNMVKRLENKLHDLNIALESFVNEMKIQGVWDQVTVIVSSDFGRTMKGNSGAGTDHGWSGHSFIMGGALDGGKIHGKYPSDLKNKLMQTHSSRLIPEVPWEAKWNAVAQWLGIADEEGLSHALPNRVSFPPELMIDRKEMFLANELSDISCQGEGEPVSCIDNKSIRTNSPTLMSAPTSKLSPMPSLSTPFPTHNPSKLTSKPTSSSTHTTPPTVFETHSANPSLQPTSQYTASPSISFTSEPSAQSIFPSSLLPTSIPPSSLSSSQPVATTSEPSAQSIFPSSLLPTSIPPSSLSSQPTATTSTSSSQAPASSIIASIESSSGMVRFVHKMTVLATVFLIVISV